MTRSYLNRTLVVMWIYWALAALAGTAGVLQSGLTKKLSERAGLANALSISNLIVLLGGVILFSLVMRFGAAGGEASSDGGESFAKVLRGRSFEWSDINWWFVVPGLCGLFMITVAPLALGRIGALPVFVMMIFGQIFASALWDWKVEGASLDRYRIAGLLLSLASAVCIALAGSTSPEGASS